MYLILKVTMPFLSSKMYTRPAHTTRGVILTPLCVCKSTSFFLFWKDLFLEGDGEVCFLTNLVLDGRLRHHCCLR